MAQKTLILFVLAICQSAKACSVTDVVLELNVSYTLTSPGYPSPYPSSSFDCLYTATAPVNSKVYMYCDVIDILYSPQCSYAWFSFSPSGSGTFADGGNYCGQPSSLTLQTTGNKFAAKFSNRLYNANSQHGFRCSLIARQNETPNTSPMASIRRQSTTAYKETKSSARQSSPLLITACECGIVNSASRIVGGTPTALNQYPWMAGLKFTTNTRPFCGGSLISSQWVLTAAHCLSDFLITDFNVILGEYDVTSTTESPYIIAVSVSQKIVHEKYNSVTLDNDIGLVKLSSTVTFNYGVSPICLPFRFCPSVDFNGFTAVTLGWGLTTNQGAQSDVLMQVQLPVVGTTQCRQYPNVSSKITANMMCTYQPGKDACQGDSGGPLAYQDGGRYYIIGVNSWGIGCAAVGNPGVYSKVNNYINWIVSKVDENLCQ